MLVFWKSELQYTYKRYAHKNISMEMKYLFHLIPDTRELQYLKQTKKVAAELIDNAGLGTSILPGQPKEEFVFSQTTSYLPFSPDSGKKNRDCTGTEASTTQPSSLLETNPQDSVS